MNLVIEKLEERHLTILDAFSCVEPDDKLKERNCNSSLRRRIKKHSKEMDVFLQLVAFIEQEKDLNTTHLLINKDANEVIGYISLCNDSIQLDFSEQSTLDFTYCIIPAIKVARLAISANKQGNRIGEMLLNFSAYVGNEIKEKSGLSFITLDCYKHRLSYYNKIGFVENVIQTSTPSHDSPISLRISLNDFLEKINAHQ